MVYVPFLIIQFYSLFASGWKRTGKKTFAHGGTKARGLQNLLRYHRVQDVAPLAADAALVLPAEGDGDGFAALGVHGLYWVKVIFFI